MLSYQHGYHAGNLADVHKHALLAWMLDYLVQKPKPLSYIETHAGRGLYDLSGSEAAKTGEAAAGIGRVAGWFSADHPYGRAIGRVRDRYGPSAYPGSPLLASEILRPDDRLTCAELHPAEHAVLAKTLGRRATVRRCDGIELALSLAPPTPRRGVLVCDPSYEVKSDYADLPEVFAKLHKAWNVGVLVLWYPILRDSRHLAMLEGLQNRLPEAEAFEVRFPPARAGHGMIGSGLFVVNGPWGLAQEAARLQALFAKL